MLKHVEVEESASAETIESLMLRRAGLQGRLDAIAADIRSGLDADSGERAVQLENREVLEEIERVTRVELERVQRKIAEAELE